MTVCFVAGSTLVVLDAEGVLPGTPSALLERATLHLGLSWIAVVGVTLLKDSSSSRPPLRSFIRG